MATVGLDRAHYAIVNLDEQGNETYGAVKVFAPAISAEVSAEIAESILYADNGAYAGKKQFKSGKITFDAAAVLPDVVADVTGARKDANGVMIDSSQDKPAYIALGFASKDEFDKDIFVWLYKVQCGLIQQSYKTTGDSVEYQTPKIEGTILRRNKKDAVGGNPWRAQVRQEDAKGDTATNWFNAVYEPAAAPADPVPGG